MSQNVDQSPSDMKEDMDQDQYDSQRTLHKKHSHHHHNRHHPVPTGGGLIPKGTYNNNNNDDSVTSQSDDVMDNEFGHQYHSEETIDPANPNNNLNSSDYAKTLTTHDLINQNLALIYFSTTFISQRVPRPQSKGTTDIKTSMANPSIIVVNTTDFLPHVFTILSSQRILGVAVVDNTNPAKPDRCVGSIDFTMISQYLFRAILSKSCPELNAACCPASHKTSFQYGTFSEEMSPATLASISNSLKQHSVEILAHINSTTVGHIISYFNLHHTCPLVKQTCDATHTHTTTATSKDTTIHASRRQSAGNIQTTTNTNTHAFPPHASSFCAPLVIPNGHPLLFAFQLLASSGVRRLFTVNSLDQVTGMYSQSMAISDISQQSALLPHFLQQNVKDCYPNDGSDDDTCGIDRVISLPITATVLDAFLLMTTHNIGGIALLNTDNKTLVGALSIRDLCGLGCSFEHIDRFSLTIKEYKKIILKEYPFLAPETHWASKKADGNKVPHGGRYVSYEDGSMADVIAAFDDGLIYRVFICDEEMQLKGVFTATDVIRLFLQSLAVYNPCEDEDNQQEFDSAMKAMIEE